MNKEIILRDLTLFSMLLSDEYRQTAIDVLKKQYPIKKSRPMLMPRVGEYYFYHPLFHHLETTKHIGIMVTKQPVIFERNAGLIEKRDIYLTPIKNSDYILGYSRKNITKAAIDFYINYFTNG